MPPQKSKYDAYFEITQEFEKCRKCPNIWLIRTANQGTNKMRHHLKTVHPEDFHQLQMTFPDQQQQQSFIRAKQQEEMIFQQHFQSFLPPAEPQVENFRKRKSPTTALETQLQGPPIKVEKKSPPPTVEFSFPSSLGFLESLLENGKSLDSDLGRIKGICGVKSARKALNPCHPVRS